MKPSQLFAWAARAQPAARLALRSPLTFAASHPHGALMPNSSSAERVAVPLVRWLATRSRSTTAVRPSGKKGGDDIKKRAVLVKVGDDAGPYNLVKDPGIVDLDRASLLEELAGTKLFAPHLAGVALDVCTVHVCASASDEKPSPDEAKSAVPLEGAKTLGARAATAPPGANLYVHIVLPTKSMAPGASVAQTAPGRANGTSPFNPDLLIPKDVWDGMGPHAQAAAAKAGAQRAALARLPLLLELGDTLPVAAAEKLGVTVLHADGGNVAAGLCTLPKLDPDVQKLPKTYAAAMAKQYQLLLLPQRLELAGEFVTAVEAGTREFGVLLSGPNGVGKSGVGLLAYLLCAARRLPAVYLSRTESWITAAQRGDDPGDAYLLSALWKQNADLIAASAQLRGVFAAALRDDKAAAFNSQVMEELRLEAPKLHSGIGVILDEVQHITAAVENGKISSDSSTPAYVTGAYFRHNWHDWMNDNEVFPRMSIASAHGERDYKLPDGEGDRMRIVVPLTDAQRDALQSHPASPAYVSDADARQRIVFYSGNVLRPLMAAARALPGSASALRATLSLRLPIMYAAMQAGCGRWLAALPAELRAKVAADSMDLVAGKTDWTHAKGLYDAGIMYRTTDSLLLRPVSAAASAAFLVSTAAYIRGAAQPLSTIADGRLRGFELERQVSARLTTVKMLVGARALDGSPSDALQLRSDYALPFGALDEVVPRDAPVLYRPLPLTHPCDGILMPAAGDADGAIVVIECSTTDPRDAGRVRKVGRYLAPGGVVDTLQRRFPALRCVTALDYDAVLPPKELTRDAAALSRGEPPVPDGAPDQPAARVDVRVLDCQSLVTLGVVV